MLQTNPDIDAFIETASEQATLRNHEYVTLDSLELE